MKNVYGTIRRYCAWALGLGACMLSAIDYEHDIMMLLNNDDIVVLGDEAPLLLATIKEIAALVPFDADKNHMRDMIQWLENGHVVASRDGVEQALDEAFDILERHYDVWGTHEQLERLIENLITVGDRLLFDDEWDAVGF